MKPVIQLRELMKDGNAFHLLGVARRAAEAAGWTQEQVNDLFEEMTSGDYAHLLKTIHARFEVK